MNAKRVMQNLVVLMGAGLMLAACQSNDIQEEATPAVTAPQPSTTVTVKKPQDETKQLLQNPSDNPFVFNRM